LAYILNHIKNIGALLGSAAADGVLTLAATLPDDAEQLNKGVPLLGKRFANMYRFSD
jgi:hypothetical protein